MNKETPTSISRRQEALLIETTSTAFISGGRFHDIIQLPPSSQLCSLKSRPMSFRAMSLLSGGLRTGYRPVSESLDNQGRDAM